MGHRDDELGEPDICLCTFQCRTITKNLFLLWWHTSEINSVNMRIVYVNMQLIYVNMQLIYIDMQHNLSSMAT